MNATIFQKACQNYLEVVKKAYDLDDIGIDIFDSIFMDNIEKTFSLFFEEEGSWVKDLVMDFIYEYCYDTKNQKWLDKPEPMLIKNGDVNHIINNFKELYDYIVDCGAFEK